MSLTRRQRVRRVGILCCHYLRNCAFYYAGWDGNTQKRARYNFWRNVNANFMDLCALELCKLFAEAHGKHHWGKVITNKPAFLTGVLDTVGMTAIAFNEYIASVKFYRDKYVAHLDEELNGKYPMLSAGKKATSYLYDYLLKHEDEGGFFVDAPGTAAEFYTACQEEGEAHYR